MCMRHVLAVAVLLASFSEDFPVLYTSRHVFKRFFNVFLKIQKNVTFYVFLHCFTRFLELWLEVFNDVKNYY